MAEPDGPDLDLHQRFRAGDDAAVQTVYERHGGAMFAVAMSVLRDRNLAADCVQQVFLKAGRSATTFDPERAPAPWLVTITRRVAIDIYRAEARRNARETGPEHAPEPSVVDLGFERPTRVVP